MVLWVLAGLVCALVQTLPAQPSIVAGRESVRGFDGDGGAAVDATFALANLQNECDPGRLEQISHLSIDSKGNLYIADSQNQRIRRIDPDGSIRTVAGSGSTPSINGRCESTSPPLDGGSALEAKLYGPSHAMMAPNGNLIIADQQNNRIRQVTPAGVVTTVAGSGQHNLYAPGIPATLSPMDWPTSLAVDAAGLIYFSEIHSNRVGRIGVDGRITTVAGTGFPGYNGDNIRATSATMRKPAGLAFDKDGNLLIADSANHRIRRVSAGGVITTVAGSGRQGDCGDDGPALDACLDTPLDVKADALGNIYIADTANHRIRRVDSNGTMTTVASGLSFPGGLAVDAANNVYIADWQNYVIRKLSFASVTNVVNAASGTAPVAPGSLIAIHGANLTDAITVNGTKPPLIAVDASMILAQLPYEVGAGNATLRVGGAAFDFPVVAAAPGIFSVADENGDGRQLVLTVTGLGQVSPTVPTGEQAGDTVAMANLAVTATVGEIPAEVTFAGLSPMGVGIGLVRIKIPAEVPAGPAIPVQIRMADAFSNIVPVAIRRAEP